MDWRLKVRNFKSTLFIFFCFICFSLESLGFDKSRIKLGKKTINIEIAKTPKDLQKGMMMRTSWGDIQGMLFVFDGEKPRSFWMKNTFLPLSIGFFSKDKVLLEVYDLKATKSLTQKNYDSVQSKKKATYVLEVPKGWFVANKVTIGQAFKFID